MKNDVKMFERRNMKRIEGDIKRKLDKGRKRHQGGVNLLMLTHNARWSSLLDPGLVSSDPVTM